MGNNTTNIGLYKADPVADKNETFNLKKLLNDNWDKIDAAILAKLLEAKGYTDTQIQSLVNAAPGALDTLKELADALGDDPNFRTTILNLIGAKVNQTDFDSHKADNTAHGIGTHNTAFNQNFETSTGNIKMNGAVSAGTSGNVARADHVHPTDTSRAPLASPALTGSPTKNGVAILAQTEGVGSGTTGLHRVTMSTSAAIGGSDGDIWLQYT